MSNKDEYNIPSPTHCKECGSPYVWDPVHGTVCSNRDCISWKPKPDVVEDPEVWNTVGGG